MIMSLRSKRFRCKWTSLIIANSIFLSKNLLNKTKNQKITVVFDNSKKIRK
jgi:hypothetical protein